ncbi:hypothetical protein PV327_008786 [Microctonus hyperodae]|uniref:Uncharacterized protein n=1 Tax=Microctonus hyperodae TaxID=165561 RepID=A0AA39KVD5_MICHY|nr:hypothetical protein PV327_008786 [Microctonus hyperodae]
MVLVKNINSRYSPWENTRSGCSSISSPGTASSESSANSHCYGRSPEDSINVDSLINNLLQTVTSDDNRLLGDRTRNPSSNFGNHQCHNCVDSYCELCLPLRQTESMSVTTKTMRVPDEPELRGQQLAGRARAASHEARG